MPVRLISCLSLPPATILSVPIADFAEANEEMASKATDGYYSCCGKRICKGCVYSFTQSGNAVNCPFCKSDRMSKTDEEGNEELMKRVEANDAGAIYLLGNDYYHGQFGLLRDLAKGVELWKQAGILGSSKAHFALGVYYREGGDLKKVKFHTEAAAMAGHEVARSNLGLMEAQSGNMGRALKHWTIAASFGSYHAMHKLLTCFEQGLMPQEAIDSTLAAYNKSCAEMRIEARDAYTRIIAEAD